MKFNLKVIGVLAVSLSACAPVHAYEFLSPGYAQAPGLTVSASASAPPPGLYGFDQVFAIQSNLTGPGNALLNPTVTKTGVQAAVAAAGGSQGS